MCFLLFHCVLHCTAARHSWLGNDANFLDEEYSIKAAVSLWLPAVEVQVRDEGRVEWRGHTLCIIDICEWLNESRGGGGGESGPPISITDSTIQRSHFDYDNAKNTSRWKFKCNFQSGWPAIFHWGFCIFPSFCFLFSLDPLSVKIEFSIWRQYLLFSTMVAGRLISFQAF